MKNLAIWGFAWCVSSLALASGAGNEQGLTASEIVAKNIAARGGYEAWRKIQSVTWVGHIESEHAIQPSMPFTLEMKRPNKTRFEIRVPGQTSVRMYDGTRGWKLRQSGQGRPEVQPYTQDELGFARDGQELDGPLMDYQAKGIAVALEGTDEVEGHRAYRLSITLPSGNIHHVWVDARTFLEVKYDRVSRGKDGQSGTVSVFYRNYRMMEGLQMPLLIESRANNAAATNKMVIDRIVLNPLLDDRVFTIYGAAGRGAMGEGDIGHPRRGRKQPGGTAGQGMPAQEITGPGIRMNSRNVRSAGVERP